MPDSPTEPAILTEVADGIWYTPSSDIWQTVWLEPVPEFRIESLHTVPLGRVNASARRNSSPQIKPSTAANAQKLNG